MEKSIQHQMSKLLLFALRLTRAKVKLRENEGTSHMKNTLEVGRIGAKELVENSGGSRFAIHREAHRDHLHKHGRCCYDKFERAPAIEWNIKFLVEQRASRLRSLLLRN